VNRKLASWLAIFGMVLNALWPLLANAGPADFSAPVCSMVGTKAVPGASGNLPAPSQPSKLGAPHCPFCTGASDHHPALAAAAVLLFVPPAASLRLPVAVEFVEPSFVLLAAHPRGPPTLS
jgi:hypothetical protein